MSERKLSTVFLATVDGIKETFAQSVRWMLPTRFDIATSLAVAALGTAAYYLLPDLPDRDQIPAISMILGASVLLAKRVRDALASR